MIKFSELLLLDLSFSRHENNFPTNFLDFSVEIKKMFETSKQQQKFCFKLNKFLNYKWKLQWTFLASCLQKHESRSSSVFLCFLLQRTLKRRPRYKVSFVTRYKVLLDTKCCWLSRQFSVFFKKLSRFLFLFLFLIISLLRTWQNFLLLTRFSTFKIR